MTPHRLPDFIIGGAPRSGTTWLYRLAERHPDICMARPLQPEPKFFLVDSLYARGIEYYSKQWFSGMPAGAVTGEKTTNYLESPQACRRIAESIPAVRLVFVLRNPVERAFSNYKWSCQHGFEDLSFVDALLAEQERERKVTEADRYSRPHAYFSRGLYADLLTPYFARFPANQLLILRAEDIVADPGSVALALHRFLGVQGRPEDAVGLPAANESSYPQLEEIPYKARRILADGYREPNQRLERLLGDHFASWDI